MKATLTRRPAWSARTACTHRKGRAALVSLRRVDWRLTCRGRVGRCRHSGAAHDHAGLHHKSGCHMAGLTPLSQHGRDLRHVAIEPISQAGGIGRDITGGIDRIAPIDDHVGGYAIDCTINSTERHRTRCLVGSPQQAAMTHVTHPVSTIRRPAWHHSLLSVRIAVAPSSPPSTVPLPASAYHVSTCADCLFSRVSFFGIPFCETGQGAGSGPNTLPRKTLRRVVDTPWSR